MSCACDQGVCEFSKSEPRRARKEHRCAECGGRIARGERYVHFAQKWEGAVSTFAICDGCDEWTTAFVDAARAAQADCDCWALGSFWTEAMPEFTREVLGYDPKTGRPNKLRLAMSRVI